MASSASVELVCVDPKEAHKVWLHVKHLIRRAMLRTGLSTFDAVEYDVLCGKGLLWIVWNGESIECAATTALEVTERGKVCVLTACGGYGMKRWLPLFPQIEAYAKQEGCICVRIFGRKGWSRVLDGYEEKHVILDKDLR